MKTWDIIDQLHPGLQITEPLRNPGRLVGGLCSAARVAIVVGIAVASSGIVRMHEGTPVGTTGVAIRFTSPRQPGSSVTQSGVKRGVITSTDTQLGLSSTKLATRFAAYFQQASDEDEYEDEYRFA
jgi:hypothetical protein